ncbi:MAG TPA: hypothetical protein DCY25_00585 [Bacteroidales bacterium]|nr:hypothetical protein [Bacteroidales bacterium]
MAGTTLKNLLLTVVIVFSLSGCGKPEVENPDDPDPETVYSRGQNVRSRAASLLNSWFMTLHNYEGMALPLRPGALPWIPGPGLRQSIYCH